MNPYISQMSHTNDDYGIRICGSFYNGFNILSYDIPSKGKMSIFLFLVVEGGTYI